MGLEEVDLHHALALGGEAAHRPQAPMPELYRLSAGPFERALQDAQPLGAALPDEALGPRAAVRLGQPATLQQILGAALDDDALVAVQMAVVGDKRPGSARTWAAMGSKRRL